MQVKTGSSDCKSPEWSKPQEMVWLNPPQNTVALVVDVRGRGGAIRIHNNHDNKYVDDVGPVKDNNNMVIIPWNIDWRYYAIGQVRVAHVQRKS